jgi:hypothetical protein
MSRRWRWCLALVTAAAVVGSFMPGALLTSPRSLARGAAVLTTEEVPLAPNGCAIQSCGRSTPTPAAPTLTLAALAALTAAALTLFAVRCSRRPRLWTAALPRGSVLALFRPPQFS